MSKYLDVRVLLRQCDAAEHDGRTLTPNNEGEQFE